MIGEVLIGIKLLQSATSAIKSAIDTGKEAGSIMKMMQTCFTAEQQIQKQKSGTVGVKDQLGLDNVIQTQIDMKLAEEAMNEIRLLVGLRFGPTFFQECLQARNDLIEAQKAKEKRRKIQAKLNADELKKGLMTLFWIISVAGIIFGLFIVYANAFAETWSVEQKKRMAEKIKYTTCRLFFQEIKDNGATRWCYYHTHIGFNRKYSTITSDTVIKCQRQFNCRLTSLTDKAPKNIKDTMKSLNKGFK